MERKAVHPPTASRLLWAQKNLEVLFDAGHWHLCPEVRKTVILDMNSHVLVAAQTNPPVMLSMINKKIEASFINCDSPGGERIRWGWTSRIIGFSNDYIAEDAAPGSRPVPAVIMTMPAEGAMYPTNVRSDYRLTVTGQDGIFVKTSPSARGVRLLNFSAGGVMISVPGLPKLGVGAIMYLNIVFPWPERKFRTNIRSLAEVAWVEYRGGDNTTRLGLRFQEMDQELRRSYNKIITHYMLVEQRSRNAEM